MNLVIDIGNTKVKAAVFELDTIKGAYVFDPEGKKYLDYGMGLRAVNIGYANPDIDAGS